MAEASSSSRALQTNGNQKRALAERGMSVGTTSTKDCEPVLWVPMIAAVANPVRQGQTSRRPSAEPAARTVLPTANVWSVRSRVHRVPGPLKPADALERAGRRTFLGRHRGSRYDCAACCHRESGALSRASLESTQVAGVGYRRSGVGQEE